MNKLFKYCPNCDGYGYTEHEVFIDRPKYKAIPTWIKEDCPECGGTGYVQCNLKGINKNLIKQILER